MTTFSKAISAGADIARIRLAVGAAAAGAIANLIGFGQGITEARAGVAGFWLFAAFVPLALVGCVAAWRLTSVRAPA